jgi:hypothetical protein
MNTYAVLAAFTVYFCVYAFRRPFTAAAFEGQYFAGTVHLKTAFVVSQIIGYTLAKYAGIKVVSQSSRAARAWMLVGLVAAAQAAMVLFAVVPPTWKVAAMLLNGAALGMVWGLVVRYLEGRQTSDFLLSGLACSFIIGGGVFQDVGRAVMAGDSIPMLGINLPNPISARNEFWMPAATGLLFSIPFLFSLWLLNQVPEPTQLDVAERTEREPMDGARRREFMMRYLPGIVPLVIAYALLTAMRDYRDYYLVDVVTQLGYSYAENKDILTHMQVGLAFGVLVSMSLLYLIKNNQRALMAVFGVITLGFIVVGLATLLYAAGQISGYWWVALVGLGGYMAYVPYNSVLFDRMMASTGFVGTAVFAIFVADSAGYTCSVGVQLSKDLLAPTTPRAHFLQNFSAFVSIVGTVSTVAAALYFWRRARGAGPTARE